MRVKYYESKYPPLGSGLDYRTPDRVGNLHLTTVVKSLQSFLKRIGSRKPFGIRDLVFDAGFVWERCLELAYRDRRFGDALRIGEVTLDGITGSPDGVGPDPDGKFPMILFEYKFTWKSSSKEKVEDNWYWMTQVKSYLKMLGLQCVIMKIAYINGNYSFSGPDYKEVRIEFTKKELDDNWRMISNHGGEVEKLIIKKFGENAELPPWFDRGQLLEKGEDD